MDYEPRSGTQGLYFRHEGFDHLLAGLHSEDPLEGIVDPNTYDRSIGFEYISELSEGLQSRLPGLEGARLGNGWTGLYPVSPDSFPQIGPMDDSATVIAACGVGGSGIQISPIVGRLAAEWILFSEPRTVPEASALVPTRFESSGNARTAEFPS
jgi:sarcosine oxidase subunit beta